MTEDSPFRNRTPQKTVHTEARLHRRQSTQKEDLTRDSANRNKYHRGQSTEKQDSTEDNPHKNKTLQKTHHTKTITTEGGP